MATRRRKKSALDKFLDTIFGPSSKPRSKRSSSGRRKAGSHPVNIVRRYQRWAATVDTNRATSLKEKNDLRQKREKARFDRDREKARAQKVREAKAKARVARKVAVAKARKERMDAAAARRTQGAQPTARTMPAPRPATQRRPTAAEVNATLCNAKCDDGTPCQNPTTGGPCSAGHRPKAKAHRSTTTRNPGEAREQFIRRGRSEAQAGANSRPLDEKGKRFFTLRDSGYKGPIDQDGYATEGNRGRRQA